MGIWAIRSPLKIHCYTCMSFKTCWSRLIYTKLSSHRSFVINMYVVTMAWRCISPWRNLEIDCDEIPVPFALLQGYWVVQNLHFLMVFAQGVQIANEATGFYMYYCRWQVAISALRFSVFTSVQSMFSSFFFWLFLLQKVEMCWHILKLSIYRLPWSDRWKLHGEIQRHAIVTTYMFMTNDWCEDSFVKISRLQHVSNDIPVYLHRISDRSNSHERRCSTRNLDDMHTIWGICL